ncbi:MAG: response regulator transcription factor [Chloroflexi bacterium]|nr:response regulator transcription factor [Chloroflexota bacterium]MBI3764767.1 response regulator transcription factor [Chloroflexota bacterium]
MAITRAFVIWTHPLFHESVRRLLSHPDIEWAGATSDHAKAPDLIASLQPNTILFEEGESEDALAEMLKILEASSSDVRVIRLSLSDNQLTVYHREQRTVAQAEDLLHLIQSD